MVDLRVLAESDLQYSVEGEWGATMYLIDPDGVRHTVVGQLVYSYIKTDPQSGDDVVVQEPVITLRKSTLTRVPVNGEKWFCQLPDAPPSTDLLNYGLTADRANMGNNSLGIVKLYPKKVKQSEVPV